MEQSELLNTRIKQLNLIWLAYSETGAALIRRTVAQHESESSALFIEMLQCNKDILPLKSMNNCDK